ncbi:hypothetical protein [Chromobacterium sp. IRSSSOUMB001]|uniref:hypothetical protein n=1 Tax=Chromobacterium sp. IRSSSOUMB001 TaxID=2927123 RepID=UPI0020BD98E2|nr:hypothetical protein [Chromobacterium sp. IRSSSOUMB001]
MRIVENLLSYDGELRPAQPSADHAWTGAEWRFDAALQAERLEQHKLAQCARLDAEADVIANWHAISPPRLVEYQRAAAEAQGFKDAGYKGEAPPAVRSWAEAKGWDGQQAADSILAKAAACEQALYAIRDARLKGKEAVRQASDETAARTAADEAVSQLRQLAAGDFAAAAPEAEAGRAGGLFKFFSKRL